MMMDNNRKVILFIAMILDGFIAGPNDDLGFLDIVRKEGEDYGYSDFIKTIDTVNKFDTGLLQLYYKRYIARK